MFDADTSSASMSRVCLPELTRTQVSQLTGGGSKQIASLFGNDEPDENERLTPIRGESDAPSYGPLKPRSQAFVAAAQPLVGARQAADAGDAGRRSFQWQRLSSDAQGCVVFVSMSIADDAVRELPGGGSSQIASLFGGGVDDE